MNKKKLFSTYHRDPQIYSCHSNLLLELLLLQDVSLINLIIVNNNWKFIYVMGSVCIDALIYTLFDK